MIEALRSRNMMSRRLSLALIVCALFARLIVPQGWMASPASDGWQITLCSGTGPITMAMPAAITDALKGPHGSGQPDHGAANHPCAFAGLTMALDVPLLRVIDLPRPMLQSWSAMMAVAVAIGRGLAAPPPPATGPPSV